MKPNARGVLGVSTLALVALLAAGAFLFRGRAAAAGPAFQTFSNHRSSGIFSLPANAKSVDWAVLNSRPDARQVRVTVFRCPVGAPKVAVAPGPVTVNIPGRSATHNANSVGAGLPFSPGQYYEVYVEDNDLGVHPTVQVWQDLGNTAIPGTRIGPDGFVQSN